MPVLVEALPGWATKVKGGIIDEISIRSDCGAWEPCEDE